MSERLIVVSTDCHAGLPIADYKPYVDAKYHEMMDMAVPIQVEMMDKASESFLIKEINDEWRAPIQQELTGAWDYKERVKMLANDGIAAEIIFPDGLAPWRITAGWRSSAPTTRHGISAWRPSHCCSTSSRRWMRCAGALTMACVA